jgi:hypothetical protein
LDSSSESCDYASSQQSDFAPNWKLFIRNLKIWLLQVQGRLKGLPSMTKVFETRELSTEVWTLAHVARAADSIFQVWVNLNLNHDKNLKIV